MQVSHVEDLASHNGPESCTATGNHGREALTGGGAGEVLSRELTRTHLKNSSQKYLLLRPAANQARCAHLNNAIVHRFRSF